MAYEAGIVYGNGSNSTMKPQNRTFFWQRKSLIDAQREAYFGQLANVTVMPKNHGKTIKVYHYIPLLDDRNINDQGIDASGAVIANGNLYGSSKDVGTITAKLPLLGENGGRVNRVGFKRTEIEGSIYELGFFSEYTEDSMQFDTDDGLMSHIQRETLTGASQISEAILQKDLINGAGTIRYAGSATSKATVKGTDLVTYGALMRLGIDLDNNRTPRSTTIITGTRYIDTVTVGATRAMYVGSELLPTLRAMKDLHGAPAFKPVEQYAAGTTTLKGEVGAIDSFRVIVVPEMMRFESAGVASASGTVYTTGGKIDVFPMMVVGDGAFSTIGFQTDGKTVKFKQIHKAPGEAQASREDPYGKTGFMSIQWWYGILIMRPERIALVYTAATM